MRWLLLLACAACGSSIPPAPGPRVAPADAAVDAGTTADVDAAAVDVAVGPHAHSHSHEVECHDLPDPATFPPVLAGDAPERAWNIEIRTHVLVTDCDHDWQPELLACLAEQPPVACEALMPPDLTQRLTAIGQLADAVATARTKPQTIGCKQAVAGHYGAARWNGKLEGFSPRVRTQIIADSRKLMLAACTREQWDDRTRACLSLGGSEVCLLTAVGRTRWGYPADGSVRVLGIAECDEYSAFVTKFAACREIGRSTRDALTANVAALQAKLASLPPGVRAQRGQSCRVAQESVARMARAAGC